MPRETLQAAVAAVDSEVGAQTGRSAGSEEAAVDFEVRPQTERSSGSVEAQLPAQTAVAAQGPRLYWQEEKGAAKGTGVAKGIGGRKGKTELAIRTSLGETVAAPVGPVEYFGLVDVVVGVENPTWHGGFYDLQYFRDRIRSHGFKFGYQQDNPTLKWFRQELERSGQTSHFFLDNGAHVPVVIPKEGGGLSFVLNRMVVWDWKEMVCQLEGESMEYVVNGPESRSGGLLGCSFSVRKSTVDHRSGATARSRSADVTERLVKSLDFVLHRLDNTAIRLHPSWNSRNIQSFPVQGYNEDVDAPDAGKGKSGRGTRTFTWYREAIGNSRKLRFDGRKRPGAQLRPPSGFGRVSSSAVAD